MLPDRHRRCKDELRALRRRTAQLEQANRLLEAESSVAIGFLCTNRDFVSKLGVDLGGSKNNSA